MHLRLQKKKAICLDSDQKICITIESCSIDNDDVLIEIPQKLSDQIRFVEIQTKTNDSLMVMVHHNEVVIKKTISSRQVQFRRSLASLQSENPDIENIIATVEKVIFDESVDIDATVKRLTQKTSKATVSSQDENLETLGVHYSETKIAKRQKRMLTSGNLAYLIDVLIHHLGKGFQKIAEEESDEEEQVGADDDDDPKDQPEKFIEIDIPTLVKICNGKVRRLIKRLVANFEKTQEEQENYSSCLMKLYAVLALLRELKSLDFKMPRVPFQESFFQKKEREKLLSEATKYLYGKTYNFLSKAKSELTNDQFDEISRLHGLLLWLAKECGADFREKKWRFQETSDEKELYTQKQSYLLFIAPDAVCDETAFEEVNNCIDIAVHDSKKADSRLWLSFHKQIGQKILKFQKVAHEKHHLITNKPKIGDMAFVRGEVNPEFNIVLKSGGKIILTDIVKGQATYSSDYIASIKLPQS